MVGFGQELPGHAGLGRGRSDRPPAVDLLRLRTRIARGVTAGSPLYTPSDDLNGDGRIDALDFVALRRLMAPVR
jgi:hypothetical protein